ncbi:hypothetical protein G6514_000586 [Epicoccum nigrum]|nr:hypothetical protein G6514_000586 [Epicoccum nigrum]
MSRRTRSGQQPSTLPPVKAPVARRTRKPPALAFLARPRDIIKADPNRQNRLFSLPKELLEQTAFYLPLPSIICLTLTCKEAAESIGTESWARYKKEKQWLMDTAQFHELLARDWGDILDYCARCNTLHPPLQPPRSHRETKLTKWCFGQDAMIDYLPQDAVHGYNPLFVHIANAMEESKEFATKGKNGPLIDTLFGDFTITKQSISWRLVSSAQRVDGNLVLRHVHTIQNTMHGSLDGIDLLNLPIRLCPHQSTTKQVPERSRYFRGKCSEINGRLLSQVITSALPPAAQQKVDLNSLKDLAPSEQAQWAENQQRAGAIWRCRFCLTKYRVQYSANQLSITTWHSFGRDLYHASKYWKWVVRRTGTTLGTDKRNDEWWSPSRTVPDFVCETE